MMIRMQAKGLVLAVVTSLCACCLAPGPASAETRIGSDLTQTPSATVFGSETWTNTAMPTGSAASPTAPSAGVLVRMRLKHGPLGSTPGVYAYRILSGAASPFTARPATVSGLNETIPFAPNAPAAIDTFTPVDADGRPRGIPISKDERLAFWNSSAGGLPVASTGGGTLVYTAVDHTSGPQPYASSTSANILMQGVIEPDADADGYGDESQDPCPAVAGLAPCPQPLPIAEPSKCKKKGKKHSAAAAKKKCKKKRKKRKER
jgi:hypothetical protein